MIIVHDECWIFPCNRWLADYEDDGKTERDLYAGGFLYPLVRTQNFVRYRTKSVGHRFHSCWKNLELFPSLRVQCNISHLLNLLGAAVRISCRRDTLTTNANWILGFPATFN